MTNLADDFTKTEQAYETAKAALERRVLAVLKTRAEWDSVAVKIVDDLSEGDWSVESVHERDGGQYDVWIVNPWVIQYTTRCVMDMESFGDNWEQHERNKIKEASNTRESDEEEKANKRG